MEGRVGVELGVGFRQDDEAGKSVPSSELRSESVIGAETGLLSEEDEEVPFCTIPGNDDCEEIL